VALPGSVVSAPAGLHGFDTSAVLDQAVCHVAKARGFSFCIRYVSRDERESLDDLSEVEARVILNAGLALMPVQHVAREGWSPTKASGTTYGKAAAVHVREIGFPPGVNVWLDLEGIKVSTSHEAIIGYCNAWITEVASGGFVPGVYVGAKAILTGEEIFWRIQSKHFWKSGSKVPNIPHRGYQLIQKIIKGDKIGRVAIDRNLTVDDNFGQSVLWLTYNSGISAA
jgi:Rv2525c-like, glycoside hydrolase-like domain